MFSRAGGGVNADVNRSCPRTKGALWAAEGEESTEVEGKGKDIHAAKMGGRQWACTEQVVGDPK